MAFAARAKALAAKASEKTKVAAAQAKAKAQQKLKGHEADPDPDRLIYDWCKELQVPEWKDKDAYASCHECGDLFKPNHQHNCRLCGDMFCSSCTKKLHVPPQFKLKRKPGAIRVCLLCVKGCLARKQEALDSGMVVHKQPGVVEQDFVLYPPAWEAEHTFTACKNCGKTRDLIKHTHNCRVCGWIHCPSCTTKVEVPDIFKHKPKPGPVRVCESCANRLKFGAILSSKDLATDLTTANSPTRAAARPSVFNYNPDADTGEGKQAVDEEEDDPDDFARRLTAGASKHKKMGGKSPTAKVFINPVKARSHSEGPSRPQMVAAAVGGVVQIRFENSSDNLMEHKMEGDSTLQDIHRKFQSSRQFPEFRFQYLYKGDPIPDVWWDVFEVQHLLPVLSIRKIESLAELQAKHGDKAELLAAASNPYSKEHRKDTAQEKKDRAAFLKTQESKKPKFRKPGQNFKKAKIGVTKAQAKAIPQIRTGLIKKGGAQAAGGADMTAIEKQDGETEFQARARYFASEV